MKSKINVLITVIALAIFTPECKKIDNENLKGPVVRYNPLFGFPPGDDFVGLFSILTQKPYYQSDPSQAPRMTEFIGYYQTARLAVRDAISIDAGDFYLNNHVISANPSDFDYYKMFSDNNQVSLNDGYKLYGTYTTFKLSGNPDNGVDSFSRIMYIPEEIEMSSPQDREIYKTTSSNIIKWNADPNNVNNVYIQIVYDGSYSNSMDSTMPIKDIDFSTIVADNGSYTIPTTVFSNMPIGGSVSIRIGRGNAIVVDKNNKKVFVSASTLTSQSFKLAP